MTQNGKNIKESRPIPSVRLLCGRRCSVSAIAVMLGIAAVIAALGITLVAYHHTIRAAERRIQDLYMDVAKVIAVDAQIHVDIPDSLLLDLIRQQWQQLENRPGDQFLCIIDQEGTILLHTLKPEVVGQSFAQQGFACEIHPQLQTIRHVIEAQKDCTGIVTCNSEGRKKEYIAAIVAVPNRHWAVALYRSRESLHQQIRSGLHPLFMGLLVVCGGLMPLSLCLLWAMFCRVQRHQYKIEQQREELVALLEAKKKELQSIVYAASHDLKTPLVNIGGFGGMLKEYCRDLKEICQRLPLDESTRQQIQALLDDDITEALGFIHSGVQQVHVLLDGLLKISRAGSVNIEPQPVDMNRLFEELRKMMQFQCQDKQVTLVIDPLPPCICDPNQAKQIFMNLLDNALKYLDPDRPGQIHISGRVTNGKVVYCVEDNGVGIESQYYEKVFEIYYRLNASDAVKGEGLGLAIVRRILDRYNGRIWLESQPQKGTCFYVELPHDKETVW